MGGSLNRRIRQFQFSWVPTFGLLCLVPLVIGCGDGLPQAVDVDITVTHQGTPLAGATVLFTPMNGGSAGSLTMATGITDANGKPPMATQASSDVPLDGVVPGDYRVQISKYVPPNGMSDSEYSKLEAAAAKAAEEGVYLANPNPLPPKVELLSEKYSSGQTELKATISADGPNQTTFDLE